MTYMTFHTYIMQYIVEKFKLWEINTCTEKCFIAIWYAKY